MFPNNRTVFFSTVAVLKNTVRLIGNIEYDKNDRRPRRNLQNQGKSDLKGAFSKIQS